MLHFCGFDLELPVETVLAGEEWPSLVAARDFTGCQWLIALVDDNPDHLEWVCAPVSVRGMQAVADGRANPIDAIRHSATGTVEIVTIDRGRPVPDRCLLCKDVPEYCLPTLRRPPALSA